MKRLIPVTTLAVVCGVTALGLAWQAKAAEPPSETQAAATDAKADTDGPALAHLRATIHRTMADLIEARAAEKPDQERIQQLTERLQQLRRELRAERAAADGGPAMGFGPGPGRGASMGPGRGLAMGPGRGPGLGPDLGPGRRWPRQRVRPRSGRGARLRPRLRLRSRLGVHRPGSRRRLRQLRASVGQAVGRPPPRGPGLHRPVIDDRSGPTTAVGGCGICTHPPPRGTSRMPLRMASDPGLLGLSRRRINVVSFGRRPATLTPREAALMRCRGSV
jgi:hypothetical protein